MADGKYNKVSSPELLDGGTISKIHSIQRSEITEHHIYKSLAASAKNPSNRKILEGLSKDELSHYEAWKKITGREISPDGLKIWFYVSVSRLLGLTFGLKLMEKGEGLAQETYDKLSAKVPLAGLIQKDEYEHEKKIIEMINEEQLKYVGSIVLGLNDALVELTGALAGLTFALQDSKIVAVAGVVTGIAASMSMAASEYLSIKSENDGHRDPIKGAIYTGVAYILTVSFLIAPYLLLSNIYASLAWTLLNAVIVIAAFTFYVSVAQEIPFRARFMEMALLSFGVAAFSFIVGIALRLFFNIEA